MRVLTATVLLRNGTDQIILELDAPTPFPIEKYPAEARVEAQYDCGIEWCRKVFGFEPKVINSRSNNRLPFGIRLPSNEPKV